MLAQARASSGVTQAALAEALQCPQSRVSKVERGERRLDFAEFIAWADALGMDIVRFIDDYRGALNPVKAGRR